MTAFPQTFLLQSGSPTVTAPPQASGTDASGHAFAYTNPVLIDEFSSNTLAPTTATSGAYNWFPGINSGIRVGPYNVDSTGSGSVDVFIFNNQLIFNSDPGAFTNGLMSQAPAQANAQPGGQSVGNTPVSTPGNVLTATTNGLLFTYGYFEASLKFSPTAPPGKTTGLWPGFWMGQQYIGGYSQYPANNKPLHSEIDMLEVNGYGGSGAPSQILSASLWQWGGFGNSGGTGQGGSTVTEQPGYSFAGFNTYGCLWTPTTITFYHNNVAVDEHTLGASFPSPINLNPTFSASIKGATLVDPSMVLILGSAGNWPMICDFVHVWQ